MILLLAAAHAACPEVQADGRLGRLPDGIPEASGLVVGRRDPDVLWVHNDSGDGPRLYALGRDGALRATYQIRGAGALDWEDVAIGPGPEPGVPYLYVGDIGDNFHLRPEVVVWRIPEPEVPASSTEVIPLQGDHFPLRYEDGAHNAEALLVGPDAAVYVVTKEPDAGVYRMEGDTLRKVGTIGFAGGPHRSLVTGADSAPGGVVLRTYSQAWWFPGALPDALAAGRGAACGPYALPAEIQGEAIAIDTDGSWLTVSEGRRRRIHHTRVSGGSSTPGSPP